MRLRDLIDEANVNISLQSQDKDECIFEMTELLIASGRIKDRDSIIKAIMAREKEGSTGIGNHVAIPHGKSRELSGLTLAIGISHSGIDFDSIDGEDVNVVFMILAGENDASLHIQALAEVVRLIRTPEFSNKLLAAKTPADVLSIIDQEE